MRSIKAIHSQVPALVQCGEFLEEQFPDAQIIEEHDTAYSAQKVAKDNDPTHAAVASEAAAELYGLKILRRRVQDDKNNITRFLELRAGNAADPSGDEDKTSLLIHTPHVPGSLFGALQSFADRDINLSYLQPKSVPNTAFELLFFIEAEAGLTEARMQEGLGELEDLGYQPEILGTYKKAEIPMSEAKAVDSKQQ
jgi:chorismate mutase/prephenate dehydratase